MKKFGVFIVMLSVVCGLWSVVCYGEEATERETIFDVIKKPFETILAPLGAEGLAGAVLRPVEDPVYPVKEFGETVITHRDSKSAR